jgi:hypothetical protein
MPERERAQCLLLLQRGRTGRGWQLGRLGGTGGVAHEALEITVGRDDEPPVRESITTLRRELDELDELADKAEESAATIPHREKYLRINHRLARRLIAAHREWIAEVERELG